MKNEALLNGYDEAIALDQNGHVCEGTIANLFIVKNNKFITPHTDSDILEGITRNTIIEIAKNEGINVDERSVDRSELYIADEIFFSGSSANITPVLSVDKRKVGSGTIGPLTAQISKDYEEVRIGTKDQFSNWLTEVNQL
ncbi:MAG TPA: aminotransferase class IV, partial [Patescibacteria group bacterium]|nr:aminotransferase class IV [Patescibacteria group bacterium]